MTAEQQELPYRIERWDDHDAHIEELIAASFSHSVARTPLLRRSGGDPARSSSSGRGRECSGTAKVKFTEVVEWGPLG
jgi:hypothetical protein